MSNKKLKDLFIEDLGKATGGAKWPPIATTLALGEEGPPYPTTLAAGEEEPTETTLALGEEDGDI